MLLEPDLFLLLAFLTTSPAPLQSEQLVVSSTFLALLSIETISYFSCLEMACYCEQLLPCLMTIDNVTGRGPAVEVPYFYIR